MYVCFILWILIQYYVIYFVAQIVPALTTGNSSYDPLTHPHYCGFSWALPYFVALQDALESSCIYPDLVL